MRRILPWCLPAARVLALGAAVVVLTFAGCSREEPTATDSAANTLAPMTDESMPYGMPINSNPKIADMLSRCVTVDQNELRMNPLLSNPATGVYTLTAVDPDAPRVKPGDILLGDGFGDPQEVVSVAGVGGAVRVKTVPADWSVVSDAGPLTFSVPLGPGEGEADGVKWGPWRLVGYEPSMSPQLTTGDGGPVDAANFNPSDIKFNGFSLCTQGSGGKEACLDYEIKVVDGTFNLDGDVDFKFDPGSCFDPTGIWCHFQPIDEVSIVAWEQLDAGLKLNIKGGGHIGVEKCIWGACLPNMSAEREFETAGAKGKLKLGIVVGVLIGLTDIEIEPGVSFSEFVEVGASWTPSAGFHGIFNANGDFQHSFKLISLGEGYVKSYIGPKLDIEFNMLGKKNHFSVTTGVDGYGRGTISLDQLFAECTNFNCAFDVGLEASAAADIKFLGLKKNKSLWFGLDPWTLAEMWGTGDLQVGTAVTGVDPDTDGFVVSARRAHPEVDPVWGHVHSGRIGCNECTTWEGSLCMELPPLNKRTDCDLVATDHVLGISDVMWNCAVEGESNPTICIKPFGKTEYTFDVACVSVFEALCQYVNECEGAGLIKNQGITQAIMAKLRAAEAARDRGDAKAAFNTLRAAMNYMDAQGEKGIDPSVVGVMRQRIRQVSEHYLTRPAVITAVE